MKIVIAADSFKGSLNSLEVADSIEVGIRRVLPKAKCVKIPMADGGEGTVASMLFATGGKLVSKEVKGPLGRKVKATYLIQKKKNTAVIEMAAASGYLLLRDASRNPMKTSSYGSGELLVDAIENGARRIYIGFGGTACIDGGVGLCQALGVSFLDKNNRVIRKVGNGSMLNEIAKVDVTKIHPGICKSQIILLYDVDNKLCGKNGAAYVYGPQKGASKEMVEQLDNNLRHYATILKKEFNQNILQTKGIGAAGGAGASLLAITGARLENGAEFIARQVKLNKYIKSAALVITGEGIVDSQTIAGKTPYIVASNARKIGIPVIAIAGMLSDDARLVFNSGFEGLSSAVARTMELNTAIRNSPNYIADAAERAIRLIMIGKSLKY